ncbi:hypothetical protein Cni_G09157 [Canna indica]|uniref:Uncharacterized protein n=1 Tax=Canna indica TaxID=4628 RepID=A0AAQ3K1S4_9LILI|nr:hypothetical protein Cni_G09157 [Canna indica]
MELFPQLADLDGPKSMELFPQLADLDGPKSMELFPQLAGSAEKEEPIKTPSLVNKINSSIGQDPDSKILIGMLDIYGFESFKMKRCLTDMPDSKKKLSSSIPGEEKG